MFVTLTQHYFLLIDQHFPINPKTKKLQNSIIIHSHLLLSLLLRQWQCQSGSSGCGAFVGADFHFYNSLEGADVGKEIIYGAGAQQGQAQRARRRLRTVLI